MGGGPSNVSQQSTTSWPAWLQPIAQQFLQTYLQQVSPGNPAAAAGGLGAGSPGATNLAPYDPAMERKVAGFTPTQEVGMQALANSAIPSSQVGGAGAQQVYDTASGAFLNSNPYLDATYGAASRGLVDQYRMATAPGAMVAAQRAGVSGGSADQQNQAYNRFSLGQNLSDLAAQVYGGNYQQERGRQLQASQLVPTAQAGLTQPGATLLGVGSLQQGQQQQQMDVGTQNAIGRAQWPFTLLSGFGSAVQQAGGGTGTSIATGPNPSASKGFGF